MENWIEPEAYRISREEFQKDKVVRDVIEPPSKLISMAETMVVLQRMATREREKSETTNVAKTARKHRATAEIYEAVMFYLRAKNEVIKAMKK